MLDRQAVIEYQSIYKEELGEDISFETAQDKATKFLRLFKMIYQPISKDYLKKINKGKNETLQ